MHKPILYAKKKKRKKEKNAEFSLIIYWILTLSFNIWFFWIIINPHQKGLLGQWVFNKIFFLLGSSTYLFPFLLFYGLIKIMLKIGKPNKGIISMFSGLLIILSFTSSILERIHYNLQGDVSGGWMGYFIDSIMLKLFGNVGSIIFSLGFILIGINIMFEINWGKFVNNLIEILKKDWEQWKEARKTFNEKKKILKEKIDNNEKIINIQPISTAPQTDSVSEIKEQPVLNNAGTQIMPEKKEKQKPAEITLKEKKKEEKVKPAEDFIKFKDFKLPSVELLNKNENPNLIMPDSKEIQEAKLKLQETLKNFNVSAYISGVYPGPVVTRFEITPSPGVKINSIVSLANDIALALRSIGSIRVIAPIPGKAAIGFEIPNHKRALVTLREIIESSEFNSSRGMLTFALGRYSEGSVAMANLEDMPHMLVAGATGSGKSVFLHSLILSIIYRNTPDEVKFVFIDPKRLELTSYESIPYLYDPRVTPDKVNVITDPREASKTLVALTRLMEKRYKKFEKARVKNIQMYNKWAKENNQPHEFYLVVVIDELADLMLQAKNVVEESIQRLTQMARAVGIHLVLATQRPSVDVITGVIKANLPCRVALQVSSKVDSRVILDTPGAESLIGKGDMLFLGPNTSKPVRIQGCYVSEKEIERVSEFLKQQGTPDYPPLVEEEEFSFQGKGGSSEELLNALKLIQERRRVSQDLLKAHFGSSARATNLLSLLEVKGFIYKPEGTNRWNINFDKIEAYINAFEKEEE